MALVTFSRSLFLLVALIKCSMISATDINIDVCRNNIKKFGDAAIVTIPNNNYQLKVVVDTTLDFQCQSVCGSLRWLYNNTEYYNNPFVESVNKRQYLANDPCTINCPSLIQCNDEDSILKGPIIYNLTVTFHKVGMYVFQCKSEMQGEDNNPLWDFEKIFEVYSKAIMIEVVKEELAISSSSSSPTFSQSSIPSPSKSSSLSPSQSVLLSPSLSPSQSLLLSSSQSTLLSPSQSFTLSNKLLSSSIGTSSHFTDSSKSPSSTFVYISTSSLATNDITSFNTVTVTTTLVITTVLTHSAVIASSKTIDNIMPSIIFVKSSQEKSTFYTLVGLLTVMSLFAIFGCGFCFLKWRIKNGCQFIKLNKHFDSGRRHNGPISAEKADNEVIENTYEIDYKSPDNKQEKASSL